MIQRLTWSHDNVVAYEASGILTKDENEQIFNDMTTCIKKCGKVRLFVRLPKLAFPELRAMGVRFKFAKEHFKDIERYTVVTDNGFVKTFSTLASLMPWMRFRQFNMSHEAEARKWLEKDNYKCKPDILLITSLTAMTMSIFWLVLRSCYPQMTRNWVKKIEEIGKLT
jgi:hypothetical protein